VRQAERDAGGDARFRRLAANRRVTRKQFSNDFSSATATGPSAFASRFSSAMNLLNVVAISLPSGPCR
jgi:hypothetical protein